MRNLLQTDPEVARAISDETRRQGAQLELIASENFVSEAVLEALGTVLTNKYAEGYPGKRYYGGCEHVDVVETLAIARVKQLFGCDHANVQPHSGAQANTSVYLATIKPGDTILGMNLSHGGHLTHGHPLNFSGRMYNVVAYGVRQEDERIDYDQMLALAKEHRPKVIVVGASAYPRTIDFAAIRAAADACGAIVFADIAHIAGLVVAGLHPSPIPHADFVTTTTHKTLRGPRGGLAMCTEKWAKDLDRAVFPGMQGGPLMHVIAAKAVSFQEALRPDFKEYQRQIVANAQVLAKTLTRRGTAPRLGRHRQPPAADRRLREGRHRQGRGEGARPRGHHRQQEHHPVRPELADGRVRHPRRHARAHHARDEGSRHGDGRPPDRARDRRRRERDGAGRRQARRPEAVRAVPAVRRPPGVLRGGARRGVDDDDVVGYSAVDTFSPSRSLRE